MNIRLSIILCTITLLLHSCSSSNMIESFLLEGGYQMYYVRSITLKHESRRLDMDFTYNTKPGIDVTCNYTLPTSIPPRSIKGIQFITSIDTLRADGKFVTVNDTMITENNKIIVLEEDIVRFTSTIKRERFNALIMKFDKKKSSVSILTSTEILPMRSSSRLDNAFERLNGIITAGDFK